MGKKLLMIFVILSVALNAFAQVFMKQASGRGLSMGSILTNIPLFFAGFFYLISIALWLHGLSKMDLSKAYPFQSLGYVLVFFCSYLFLGEKISVAQLFGLAIICAGILVLGISA
jgi:multidrug transporter EmrE-like cation transporter